MRKGFRRVIGSAMALTSCGLLGRDLDRAQAKVLIEGNYRSTLISEGELAQDSSASLGTALDAGVLEELWLVPEKTAPLGQMTPLQLTERGKRFFAEVGVSRFVLVWRSRVTLAQPIKVQVIDVTGLRKGDAEEKRVAEYTWKFDAPSVVLRYLGLNPGPMRGEAACQLYDDGWRLVNVDTGQQVPQMFVRDPQAEAAGRAARDEQQRQEAEAKRLREERWQLAQTPTKVLGKYHFERLTPRDGVFLYDLDISDVGFSLAHKYASGAGSFGTDSYGWWEVLGVASTGAQIEIKTRRGYSDHSVTIEDDGKGPHSISDAVRDLSQALQAWRDRFPEFVPQH